MSKKINPIILIALLVSLFTINANAGGPYAGQDTVVCSTQLTLYASPYPGATWTVVSGTGYVVNPNMYNSLVTNLGKEQTVLRWGVPGQPYFDDLIIKPFSANAGLDQHTQVNYATLSATPLSYPGHGNWYNIYGSGSIYDYNSAQTEVTQLSKGKNTFKWYAFYGNCSAYDDVDIYYEIVNAGKDSVICTNSIKLYATALEGGSTGKWSVIKGSATIENETLFNSNLTNLGTGENILRWETTILNKNVYDDITITNNSFVADAGIDQNVTANNTFLSGSLPQDATGEWGVVAGNATIVNNTLANTQITNLSIGTNTFKWFVQSTGCYSYDLVSVNYTEKETCSAKFSFVKTDGGISIPENVYYQFTNKSTGTNIIETKWSFTDSISSYTSTKENPVQGFYMFGKATAKLTIKTEGGCTDTYSSVIFETQKPIETCQANFSFTKTDGGVSVPENINYQFTNKSVGTAIIETKWSFTDSISTYTSTEANPIQGFYMFGTAKAELTIKTQGGCTSSFSSVIFNNPVPAKECKVDIYYQKVESFDAAYYLKAVSETGENSKFEWNFSNGDVMTGNGIYYKTDKTGLTNLCVTMTTPEGCVATDCDSINIEIPQNNYVIKGKAFADDKVVNNAIVILFANEDGHKKPVDKVVIVNNEFVFKNVPAGKYLVYAIPNYSQNAGFIPTYWVSSHKWENAKELEVMVSDSKPVVIDGIDIQLMKIKKEETEQKIGQIKGNLNFEQEKLIENLFYGDGNWLNSDITKNTAKTGVYGKNVTVILYSYDGQPVAWTVTDENGNYSFDNIPAGQYYVEYEKAGFTVTDKTIIEISESKPTANFDITVTSENQETTELVQIENENHYSVFPNPFNNFIEIGNCNSQDIISVNITSVTGKKVLTVSKTNKINTENLPTGVYFINIQTKNANNTTKLVKVQ